MPAERVYLDHAATTPVDPRVVEAMLPFFTEEFGNPSSVHLWGQRAEAAVESARHEVADVLGCAPEEILFTSCGTESDNLALRGMAFAERERRGANRILTTPTEHPAVLRTARQLSESFGFALDLVPVDEYGFVHPEDLDRALRPDTAVASVIYANNEIGTINPVAELAAVCRGRGVPFHTDAVQAASQSPLSVGILGVDMMSMGAHKFYGPKGVGALFVRSGLRLMPALTGGSQESSLRAGTQNVPLIVGLATALVLTQEESSVHNPRFSALRDRLLAEVPACVPDARVTGHPAQRMPNHASFVFRGVDGNALLAALDLAGFGCSSGSACKTGEPEPSEVLLAIGQAHDWALGSLRVTVGRGTTLANIEAFIEALPAAVDRVRAAKVSQA